MTRPVAVNVSQATRLAGSSVRQASRIASEIWSAILSGWPSVTDSEVNRQRVLDGKCCVSFYIARVSRGNTSLATSLQKPGYCKLDYRAQRGLTKSNRQPRNALAMAVMMLARRYEQGCP